MNSTMGTVGVWDLGPFVQVFNTVNEGFKLVAKHIEFTEQTPQISGTIALLELAKKAEKEKWAASTDLGTNHDKYFSEAWNEQQQSKK